MMKKIIIVVFLIIILTTIFLTAYSAYSYLNGNIEKIAVKSLKKYANLNIDVKDIKIGVYQTIKIKGFKLYDKYNGSIIISADEVVIKYDLFRLIFGDRRISEIAASGAKVDFILSGKLDINIVKTISSGKKKGYSAPIIEKITIKNSTFKYSDLRMEIPVVREATNANGVLVFDDSKKSLKIHAHGERGKEDFEYTAEIGLDKKEYNMNLNLKNIGAEKAMLQYIYRKGDIDIKKGLIDLDLLISSKDRPKGKVVVKDVVVKTLFLDKEVSISSGEVVISPEKISITAAANFEGSNFKGNAELRDFTSLKTIIIKGNFRTKEADLSILKHIEALKKTEIPATGILKNANVDILLSADKKLSVKAQGIADEVLIKNEKIEKIDCDIEYAIQLNNEFGVSKNTKGILIIKKGKAVYNDCGISISGYVIDEKKQKLEVNIVNIIADKYIEGIEKKLNVIIKTNGEFKGRIEDGIIYGEYFVDVKNKNIEIDKIAGKIDYNIFDEKGQILFSNEKIVGTADLDIKRKNVLIDFEIKDDLNVDYQNVRLKLNGFNKVEYDFSQNKLISLIGKIEINDIKTPFLENENGTIDRIVGEYYSDGEKIFITNAEIEKKKSYLNINGEVSLDQKLDFTAQIKEGKINVRDFEIPKEAIKKLDIDSIDYDGIFNISGKLRGNSGTIYSDGEIKSDFIIAKVKKNNFDIAADINYIKNSYQFSLVDGKPEVSIKSLFKEVNINKNKFSDITSRIEYKNGKLYINELKNNMFAVFGDVSEKGDLNFTYSIKDIELEKYEIISSKGIKGYIKELNGEIRGSTKAPEVTFILKPSIVKYKISSDIVVMGEGAFKEGKVFVKDLKVEQNTIKGVIDIENDNVELKINLFEPSFKKYYTNDTLKNINARITGEINVWGKIKDLKANSQLNIDSIYYNEYNIPNVFAKISYNKNILNISKINIFNLEGSGSIDLEKQDVNMLIDNRELDISKFQFVAQGSKITGKADIYFLLKGKIDKPDFNLMVSGEKINIETSALGKVDIENLRTEINGNKNEIKISKFEAEYNGDLIKASGYSKSDMSDYDIEIEAEKLNLNVFSIFTRDNLKEIKGNAKIKLNFKKNDFEGNVTVEDLGFVDKSGNFNFVHIYGGIVLNKDQIYINNFVGQINTGKFDLNGSMKLSGNIISDSDVKINFYGFDYAMGKALKTKLDGNIALNDNNITGKVYINEGEVRGIPAIENNPKENQNNLLEKYNIKIDVETRKDVVISIYDFAVLQYIEAYISGSGRVIIDKGKANFTGTLTSNRGVVTFNDNEFTIEKAVVSFDDLYQYWPDLNPSISIYATTTLLEEPIYAEIGGYLKSLNEPQFYKADQFSENNKMSKEQIVQMLTFKTELKDGVIDENNLRLWVQERLNKEFTKMISQKLEKSIGLEKLTITTKLFDLSDEQNTIKDPRLGAIIEGEKAVYKDIWTAGFSMKLSETEVNKLEKYDLSLNYKLNKNLSLSVGTGKDYSTTNTIAQDTNSETMKSIIDILNLFRPGFKFKGEF